MKLNCSVKLNLKLDEAKKQVEEATRQGLRDTIVAIHNDAIKGSPKKTGNNMRSISSEVSGMGMVASGGEGGVERMVDDSKLEAAVYSTSGYGGYLETGTYKMPARPYFRPALDMNKNKLIPNIKEHLNER
jgi:HK97 gp10 family phage protein